MDKGVMHQVPAIRGKKEVLSLLPVEPVLPQRRGFKACLAEKRQQERFFHLFIMALLQQTGVLCSGSFANNCFCLLFNNDFKYMHSLKTWAQVLSLPPSLPRNLLLPQLQSHTCCCSDTGPVGYFCRLP